MFPSACRISVHINLNKVFKTVTRTTTGQRVYEFPIEVLHYK